LGDDARVYTGTVVNLNSGSIGRSFESGLFSGFGGEVNISGGSIGQDCLAGFSTFTMTGGDIGIFFFCDGSTIDVTGGTIGQYLLASSCDLTIGGTASIGRDATISRSNIAMSGGAIASDLEIRSSSDLLFSGGEISSVDISQSTVANTGGQFISSFDVMNNSVVEQDGGDVWFGPRIQSGSVMRLAGGSVGSPLVASAGTTLEISGGDFEIDGVPAATGQVNLPVGALLTGVMSDGTVFVFNSSGGVLDSIPDGTLTLVPAAIPPQGPAVINAPADPVPAGLRPGQTLNMQTGAAAGVNFTAIESEINLADGWIERGLELVSTTLNVTGGTIGFNPKAYANSFITQSSGSVSSMRLYDNSTYHLTGGICSGPSIYDGAACSVFGGELLNWATVYQGGKLNIAAGIINRVRANVDGEVNLAGTEFRLLDLNTGALIEDLTPQIAAGQRIVIADRDVTLAGTLLDGSPISLNLNSVFVSNESQFNVASIVTVGLTLEDVMLVVEADSVAITRGNGSGGGISELGQDDSNDFSISRSSFDIQSVTEFEMTATTPVSSPNSLQFVLDGSVFARSAVTQSISLFNYDTGQFEIVDSQPANRFGDKLVIVTATGDVTRFVDASGQMQARVRFQSASQRQQFSSNTDRAVWLIGG
ncbi:MAG: hypothetical protein AAF456_06190, partial [Planctomycetota bacterium]